jgi:hypothetical protein
MSAVREMPAAPAIIVSVFVLGGLAVVPASVLITTSAVTSGAVLGGLSALVAERTSPGPARTRNGD